MFRSRRKGQAFTLVELLVVIAIIGILIALLLPAVQAAREAARRSQCSNNCKQLALAMHNYNDVHKTFPYNYSGNGQYNNTNTGKSWIVGVLPFIEQQPLYDQIDWGQPVGDSGNPTPNTAVGATVIDTLLCPSDDNDEGLMGTRANVGGSWAVNNYKACAGGNWGWGDNPTCRFSWPKGRWPNSTNGLDQGNGIICRNSGNSRENVTKFSHIRDGTSNTFALGEAVPAWCTHTWWWWFNGATATCGIPLNYESNAIRANPATVTLETQWGDWGNNYSFFSRHPGGANFGICDGSVTFVSDTIDILVYRHLANMDDREPVQVP
jgi:prepilin-type N-terminal cleavage/methylation domain-containing protein/prepilin-type processing-associated H-X9-DG protein